MHEYMSSPSKATSPSNCPVKLFSVRLGKLVSGRVVFEVTLAGTEIPGGEGIPNATLSPPE